MEQAFTTSRWLKIAVEDEQSDGLACLPDGKDRLRRLSSSPKSYRSSGLERMQADLILSLRVTTSDLSPQLQESYYIQLHDSTTRASVELYAAQEAVYAAAGLTGEERFGASRHEQLRDLFQLSPGSSPHEIEQAFEDQVALCLDIPDHLTFRQGLVLLQQRQFLKNMGLRPDSTKSEQIRQIEVVNSFGKGNRC